MSGVHESEHLGFTTRDALISWQRRIRRIASICDS
jgi:hypothetical protein